MNGTKAINWRAETAAVVENSRRLIRIDTTNPPGNELPAALLVRDLLECSGFPKLEILSTSSGAEFPVDTSLYRLLEKVTREMDPQGLVFPFILPGATDGCEYKRAGITVYGFTPGILPKELPVMKMAHGHDERLPISYIETGLPVLWQVIEEFCR